MGKRKWKALIEAETQVDKVIDAGRKSSPSDNSQKSLEKENKVKSSTPTPDSSQPTLHFSFKDYKRSTAYANNKVYFVILIVLNIRF